MEPGQISEVMQAMHNIEWSVFWIAFWCGWSALCGK